MSAHEPGRRAASWLPALVGVTALLVVGVGGTAAGQAKPLPEAAVKAAFVIRFPEFVAWPTDGPGAAPVVMCFSPSHRFGPNLSAGVPQPGQRVRRVTVRQLQALEEANGCNAVYVAEADTEMLGPLATRPVLTVGDQPGFCQRGGIINLLVIEGRVRFEINLGRARLTGLRIDSQLLRLATKVYGGTP